MKQVIKYLIILIPSLFMGCHETIPVKKEISGIWVSPDGAELSLNIDGTFKATSLPAELFFVPADKYYGEKFNGTGRWVIKNVRKPWDQLPWSIDFDFIKTSDPKYLCSRSILISGNGLMENKPPWRNLFFWKAEEGGERYEFKKK